MNQPFLNDNNFFFKSQQGCPIEKLATAVRFGKIKLNEAIKKLSKDEQDDLLRMLREKKSK